MKCLETNKVCASVKKCKVCIFDDCRNTIEMIEKYEKQKEIANVIKIKEQLEGTCKNCNMLQILDKEKQKIYCPYRLKNECLIRNYIKRGGKT